MRPAVISVVVIDAEAEERFKEPADGGGRGGTSRFAAGTAYRIAFRRHSIAGRVIVWTEPVTREEILRDVVNAAHRAEPSLDPQAALRLLQAREAQGSMFLNEGVALPHVRVPESQTHVAGPRAGAWRRDRCDDANGPSNWYLACFRRKTSRPSTSSFWRLRRGPSRTAICAGH